MNILRWMARLGSLLSVAFVLLFLFGEGLVVNGVWPTATEWVGLLFFPFGLAIGLLIGWRDELWGGLIAAGSIAAFYVWSFAVRGSLPTGPYFLLFALPAFIYMGLAWRESVAAG